nr:MAG TPA: hypothetical protein [Caudoviricetes sp.]
MDSPHACRGRRTESTLGSHRTPAKLFLQFRWVVVRVGGNS